MEPSYPKYYACGPLGYYFTTGLMPEKQKSFVSFCRHFFGIPKVKLAWLIVLVLFFKVQPCYPGPPENIRGVFLPPPSFNYRKIEAFLHYASLAGLNSAVLHVKDPRGRIYWKSNHPAAVKMGAHRGGRSLGQVLGLLKKNRIWVIAKFDVFADTLFADHNRGKGIMDSVTGSIWKDNTQGSWTNPHDPSVWAYNIALARELALMGFDEIQFDYVRFPSDGNLERIRYPFKNKDQTRARSIGLFLKEAAISLRPFGVTISVDLFGLTAWRTEDFGVGQVLEYIIPHVDVICPMFYPSHFPEGFLGLEKPGRYPARIMEQSLYRMKKRTSKKIRPWIQGFWYEPDDIMVQMEAAKRAEVSGWMVWNSSGEYSNTYLAIARQKNTVFARPKFYPSLAQLLQRQDRIVKGNHGVVNYTGYSSGYSILTLEPPGPVGKRNWSTPVAVIATLDEAVMDQILTRRQIPFSHLTEKYTKTLRIARLMVGDLKVDPKLMQPGPVLVDWGGECLFSRAE